MPPNWRVNDITSIVPYAIVALWLAYGMYRAGKEKIATNSEINDLATLMKETAVVSHSEEDNENKVLLVQEHIEKYWNWENVNDMPTKKDIIE